MIPGNLDKLPQKIWAACKRKTKGLCPGNARGKMDADPLVQKAPHGSVGLAGARLKEPLWLSSGSRRHAEGEFCYHCKQQDCWPSSLWTKGVEETTHSPSHCGLVLKRGANGVRHAVGVWNWTHWRKGSICWAWPHSTDVDGPQDEVMLTNSQVFLILLVQDHTEQTGSRFPDSYAYNQSWYCQTVEFMLVPLLSPGPGVSK